MLDHLEVMARDGHGAEQRHDHERPREGAGIPRLGYGTHVAETNASRGAVFRNSLHPDDSSLQATFRAAGARFILV
jgi:hypothetical protein